ncbi:uncharacterized protein cep164 isoform X1 [Genypterus blacodes]|uniref:uncharacterized protein cep164 isoform X1 n=1 Tax=Genypterus blacodes TaxID=154954 RepID=UPI003F75BB29
MSAAALIGDQLILQEDYDENYTPSEQEIHEYAREIGIDPNSEPNLLWLAREGIVAPLPPEWKPCQDVTGDIYYFNFSTGQSTWDHPCDEHYRRLVSQERERAQVSATTGGPGVKKEKERKKKEKKEKKEKKKKEILKTSVGLTSSLGPLSSPLGVLAPLRGLDAPGPGPLPGSAPPLRGSLGSSGGLEPLKTSLGGLRGSGASSVLGSRQEERVSLFLPGFDDDNDSDDSEKEPSPRGSTRLLKNLHLDLDSHGGGLQYEDSEASGGAPAEERTEPELQDLALSGDHSPEPPSQQDSLRGRHRRLSPQAGNRNCGSEEGVGPIAPQPPSTEFPGHRVEGELDKVEEEELGEVEDERGKEKGKEGVENEEAEDEEAVEKYREGVEGEEEEEEQEAEVVEDCRKEEEKEESDSVEEECKEKGDGVTENMTLSKEKQESDESEESKEGGEDDSDKEERYVNKQGDQTKDRGEEWQSDEAVENRFTEEKDEVSEEIHESGEELEEFSNEDVKQKLKSEKDERREEHESEAEQEKIEVQESIIKERGQDKVEEEQENESEEDVESEGPLERCSLSQRQLTESDEEVLERCVWSEEGETKGERMEAKQDTHAQNPQAASGREEEGEVVETETAPLQSAKPGPTTMQSDLKRLEQKQETVGSEMRSVTKNSSLPAEESEASEHMDERSSSMDVKLSEKVFDINDLSGAVSPLEKNNKEEMIEEEDEERARTKRPKAVERHIQARNDIPPAPKVERLVLHQSSHSLSSPSHSEREVGVSPNLKGLSSSLALQRPVTSRGRLGQTSNTQLEESKTPIQDQRRPLEKTPSWRTQREGETEEEQREKEEERGERKKQKEVERERREAGEEEEEREHVTREKEKRLRLLRDELRREEEGEERKLKEESEERVRALEQRLQSKRRDEEARLNEESDRRLEELRESSRRERESQQHKLRDEAEAGLRELRVTLEEEREAEQGRLENQRRQDIERLKAESEEKLQEERKKLLEEREEELNSLKQEVKSTERRRELLSPRPEQQLVEYHRELGDVLQEVREEVQRDHDRKLEQLRENHRRELNSIREKYQDEETVQRDRLLTSLQEDRERLQASNQDQLETLHLQLDAQIQRTQLNYTRKESELQDSADKLELRAKELKSQEAMLMTKAANLKRRRKKLGEEEGEVDRQIEALPQLIQERDQLRDEVGRLRQDKDRARELAQRAKEERSEAKQEMDRLREERDKAREESRRAKKDKERLESKVALLQERCDCLSRRVSELERNNGTSPRPEPKQQKKKAETEATAPPSDRRDSSLRVDDLEDLPLSPVPDSHSSVDDYRRYISSHGLSIQKTKQFLEGESSRLMERQAALQAAQSHSSLDPSREEEVAQEMMRNLQQEAINVAELQLTFQRGSTLLRRKEEQLQQLESRMAEEPLFEGVSQLAGERRVTFDVTESDLSSTVDPQDGTGGHPTVPAKVQELAESLQQISGQLHTVLGALGSLAQGQSTTSYPAFHLPLSQPHSNPLTPGPTFSTASSVPMMPQSLGPTSLATPSPLRLSEPLWAWAPQGSAAAPPLFSTPMSSGVRASEELINSRWNQIFPGASMEPGASSTMRTTSAYSAYTPVRENSRTLQKSVEMDGQRLQGLIDGNKKWLEMRRKDSSIPLFTRYRAPSAKSGLVQLGMDDNNQIRVYHY